MFYIEHFKLASIRNKIFSETLSKHKTLIILMFSLLLTIQFPITISSNSSSKANILELNQENWEETVSQNEYLFVLFYKKNSKRSEEVLTEMEQSASSAENKKVTFGLVEKDESGLDTILSNFNLKSFPKVILFYMGQPIEYENGLLLENFNFFLKMKQENRIIELKSHKEFEEFRKKKETVTFIGDTSSKYSPIEKRQKHENKKYSAFIYASKYYDDVIFAECASDDCLEAFENFGGLISVYNGFHNEISNLDSFSTKQLINFVNEKTTKIYPELDEPTSKVIFIGYSTGIFLFLDKQNEEQKINIFPFYRAARNLKKAIHLVVADYSTEIGSQAVDILKLKFADLPKVFIIDCRTEEIQLFRMDREITEENIFEFAKNWGLNKLNPLVFSEEIPTKQTFPILTVVGKNYKELVIESSQDFLIYYFSEKCEACKRFEKIYRKVANAIIKEYQDLILFGKINGEINDVERVSILAYPSIIFYLKGNKENPIKYELNDFEIGNLVEFIAHSMKGEIDLGKIIHNIQTQEEENTLNTAKADNSLSDSKTGKIDINYVEDVKKDEI